MKSTSTALARAGADELDTAGAGDLAVWIAGDAVPDPLGHVDSAREREVQQHRWALPDVGAS